MSARSDIIARLQTVLKTTSVKTVVSANGPIDPSRYATADLPLVAFYPVEEAPVPYLTGKEALWACRFVLTCYFLDDIVTDGSRETLIKELKDALGADTTLNETACDVDVGRVMAGGTFPLWAVGMEFTVEYLKGIANA